MNLQADQTITPADESAIRAFHRQMVERQIQNPHQINL